MKTRFVMQILIVFIALTQSAFASVELHSNDFYGNTGGVGSGRGIGLHADSSFSMTSLGLFGSLNTQSFDAQVYSSTDGHDIGSLLASSSAVIGGSANQYNDITLSFNFLAGNFYTLLFRPTEFSSSWANTIDYFNDSGLPLTIGAFTLIDGTEGFLGENFSNFLHPNLRLNASAESNVPEPGALGLLALGLIAMRAARRKNRA